MSTEMWSAQIVTAAVAPIVMVSAAGLLFIGMQTRNLNLADRIRSLAAEFRAAAVTAERREQITSQLHLFQRRIRLSQRALEANYLAVVCFVLTSLLLAATPLLQRAALLAATSLVFIGGVVFVLIALILTFIEMRVGLVTIAIELRDVTGERTRTG